MQTREMRRNILPANAQYTGTMVDIWNMMSEVGGFSYIVAGSPGFTPGLNIDRRLHGAKRYHSGLPLVERGACGLASPSHSVARHLCCDAGCPASLDATRRNLLFTGAGRLPAAVVVDVIALVLGILTIAIIVEWYEHDSKEPGKGAYESVLSCFQATTPPGGRSVTRFAGLVHGFAALVFVAVYTANMASFMMLEPVQTVKGFGALPADAVVCVPRYHYELDPTLPLYTTFPTCSPTCYRGGQSSSSIPTPMRRASTTAR